VRCPEGKDSTSWTSREDKRGRYVKVRFSPSDCRACLSQTRCTKAQGVGRQLALPPRPEYEALIAARARQDSEAGRRLYALRAGIEGTLSQAARAFGLRQTRYRGLAKTRLQNTAIAAALNLDRISAWLSNRPLAPSRTSRFAALAA
jgi:transposase